MGFAVRKKAINSFLNRSTLIILDLVLIYLFFGKFTNQTILLSIILWFTFNYFFERYHNTSKRLDYQLIRYFFIVTLFLITDLLFNGIFNILLKNISNIYALSFLIISFITNIVFKQNILPKFSKKTLWHFIGEKKEYEILIKYIKIRKVNIVTNFLEIDKINTFTFKNQALNNFSNGLIYQDGKTANEFLNKYKLELNQNNIVKLELVEWFESYLQLIPTEFLDKNDTELIWEQLNSKRYILFKRLGDLIFSIFLLIPFLPVILISIFLIFIEDGTPLFYSQKRNGFLNNKFTILKLRSMFRNSELEGPRWSTKFDKRITKIGSLLRITRIDEIPQIISVISGKMSLIGPRPERPEIDLMLKQKIINYDSRYFVNPGLSGWAQVNYPYGSSEEDSKNKLSFDLFYIKHCSFLLDIIIFIKTIRLVVNAKGSIPEKA